MAEMVEYIPINEWAVEDRPREKLLSQGRNALSNAELLAILIGSGSSKESAVDLCKRILSSVDNDLNKLGKLSVNDLSKFKGIGEAKAITIMAALEFGRRRAEVLQNQQCKILNSKDAFQLLKQHLLDLPHEEFWVILLNRANVVISKHNISKGGVSGTVVDNRIIIKLAVESLAAGIILAHNHPSGNLEPSKQDLELTQKLKNAAKLFDINIMDHLIVGDNNYKSFNEEGWL